MVGIAAILTVIRHPRAGSAMGLSQWVLDISPFTHLPHLPGGHVTVLPLILLCGVAIVLCVAGITGFRRRDIPA